MEPPDVDPVLALRRRVARGERARQMLEDETLKGVMDDLVDQAVGLWRVAVGAAQLGLREQQHAVVVGIDSVRSQLRALIADADMARAEIEALDDAESD